VSPADGGSRRGGGTRARAARLTRPPEPSTRSTRAPRASGTTGPKGAIASGAIPAGSDAPPTTADRPEGARLTALAEERDFLLSSLRDLEAEHDAGDLADTDYATLKRDYTARAAAVLDALDALDSPGSGASDSEAPGSEASGSEASGNETSGNAGAPRTEVSGSADAPDVAAPETPAGAESPGPPGGSADPQGPTDGSDVAEDPPGPPAGPAWSRRQRQAIWAAAFVVAGTAIGWGIHSATTARAPGDTVSGLQSTGTGAATTQLLSAAEQAAADGDVLTAIQDYQRVLQSDPSQVQALAGEGWLLVQTQQTSLVAQGAGLLKAAELADPTYGPAHVYRGLTLYSQGDDRGAVAEFQYYLGHNPDPSLTPRVRQVLAEAQAASATGSTPSPTPATPQTTSATPQTTSTPSGTAAP